MRRSNGNDVEICFTVCLGVSKLDSAGLRKCIFLETRSMLLRISELFRVSLFDEYVSGRFSFPPTERMCSDDFRGVSVIGATFNPSSITCRYSSAVWAARCSARSRISVAAYAGWLALNGANIDGIGWHREAIMEPYEYPDSIKSITRGDSGSWSLLVCSSLKFR